MVAPPEWLSGVPWPAPPSALGRAAGIGGGLAVAVVVGQRLTGASTADAVALSFALGALVFGFALTAWATSLLSGNALGAARAKLGGDRRDVDDVTEAMAVLATVGGSWMLVAGVVSAVAGV